jgi:hypothetical protein
VTDPAADWPWPTWAESREILVSQHYCRLEPASNILFRGKFRLCLSFVSMALATSFHGHPFMMTTSFFPGPSC